MTTTALKLTALALMFIDHIYEFIPGAPLILTILGRISAPVFLFCCVWGFHYTHSRKTYLTRMYICSALMGILDSLLNMSVAAPYQVCFNNVFSMLLWVCLFIAMWERARGIGGKVLMVLGYLALNVGLFLLKTLGIVPLMANGLHADSMWSTAIVGMVPDIFTCEGDLLAISMGIVLYFCKGSKKKLCWGYGIFCAAYFGLLIAMGLGTPSLVSDGWVQFLFRDAIQWMQIFALPFMLLYNGQRGRGLKYLFYIFYPAHIAILFCLGNLLAA